MVAIIAQRPASFPLSRAAPAWPSSSMRMTGARAQLPVFGRDVHVAGDGARGVNRIDAPRVSRDRPCRPPAAWALHDRERSRAKKRCLPFVRGHKALFSRLLTSRCFCATGITRIWDFAATRPLAPMPGPPAPREYWCEPRSPDGNPSSIRWPPRRDCGRERAPDGKFAGTGYSATRTMNQPPPTLLVVEDAATDRHLVARIAERNK